MSQPYTPLDLLLALPRTYQDNSIHHSNLADLTLGEVAVVELQVLNKAGRSKPRRCLALEFRDRAGKTIAGTAYIDLWRWKFVQEGNWVTVRTRKALYGGRLALGSPVLIEPRQKVEPIYSPAHLQRATGTEKLNPKGVGSEVAKLLRDGRTVQRTADHISHQVNLSQQEIANRIGVVSLARWLSNIHRPENIEIARSAWVSAKRLAVLHIHEIAAKSATVKNDVRSVVDVKYEWALEWMCAAAMVPTSDQTKVILTLFERLRNKSALRAILTADVGYGKSLPFYLAAAATAKAGRIAVIMVPREILITKTTRELRTLVPDIDVIEYRDGEKFVRPLDGGIYVGTHALNAALLKRGINPRFIVVDEQQKFSRQQREALLQPHTNFLEVSATPIPRSFGLLLTGGRELLEIRETPFTKDIRTYLLSRADRESLVELIKRTVANPKARAMVVYPLIEGGGEMAPELAKLKVAMEFWKRAFPGKVVEIHGRMDAAEQQAALDRLVSGEAKIACCTTVAELGITVEGLTAMVVVQPDRLGAGQLHQLRGRLARHGGRGVFAMYCLDKPSESALERLSWLVKSNDGYDISQKEFLMRGSGDLAVDSSVQDGRAKSVLPNFPIKPADLLRYQPCSANITTSIS